MLPDDEARHEARFLIRTGIWSRDAIIEMVAEMVELSDAEATRIVDAEYDEQRAEEQTWPDVTDVDQLERAFTALLERHGVISVIDAGYSQSEGLERIKQEFVAELDNGRRPVGFCFCTGQDIEFAVRGAGIMLTFGALDEPGDDAAIRIGRLIVDALEEQGLETDWDGTFDHRIHIRMGWHRRLPAA